MSRRSGVEWFRLRNEDLVEVEATETLGDSEEEIEFETEVSEGTGSSLFEYVLGIPLLLPPTGIDKGDASWSVKDSRLPRTAPDWR